MILEQIRLKPFDFIVDAARQHFYETGVRVNSFLVPQETLVELKKDARTVCGGFEWQAYVMGMMIVGSNNCEPILVDQNIDRMPLL